MINYSMITKGIMEKVKECMELNEKAIDQNLWDAMSCPTHEVYQCKGLS